MAYTSLSAVTSPEVGSAQNLLSLLTHHTMVTTVTGTPSTCEILMEGSLDNSTWITLGVTNGTGSCHSVAAVVQYVRANLTTLGGGSSPTVTAKLGSAGV